jgi:hypothetical protein
MQRLEFMLIIFLQIHYLSVDTHQRASLILRLVAPSLFSSSDLTLAIWNLLLLKL